LGLNFFLTFTQGSERLATLGWMTESRWDSWQESVKGWDRHLPFRDGAFFWNWTGKMPVSLLGGWMFIRGEKFISLEKQMKPPEPTRPHSH